MPQSVRDRSSRRIRLVSKPEKPLKDFPENVCDYVKEACESKRMREQSTPPVVAAVVVIVVNVVVVVVVVVAGGGGVVVLGGGGGGGDGGGDGGDGGGGEDSSGGGGDGSFGGGGRGVAAAAGMVAAARVVAVAVILSKLALIPVNESVLLLVSSSHNGSFIDCPIIVQFDINKWLHLKKKKATYPWGASALDHRHLIKDRVNFSWLTFMFRPFGCF